MAKKKGDTLMAASVEYIAKQLKYIDSLIAFRENAKRQWGTIADTLFDTKGVRIGFRKIINENQKFRKLLDELLKLRNRSSISSCLEDLSYALDNIKMYIEELLDVIEKSDIFSRPIFKDSKILNEDGKRLGLKTLIQRSTTSLKEIEKSVNKIIILNDNNVRNVILY